VAEPSLRDRVAPYLPYWPWVVVPALVLAIALLASRSSSQARQLDLMRGDLHALEQQLSSLKKARNSAAQPSLLSGLQQPQAAGARAGKARTAGTAPRSRPAGAAAGKTGKRAKRAPATAPVAEPTETTP
jgi:hypothetical protein